MKPKSIKFYKRLILVVVASLIILPTIATIVLLFQNISMKTKLDSSISAVDDAVTVGATQLEPAGVAREKPVLSYQMLYPDFKSNFYGFEADVLDRKTVFLTFDDGPSAGTDSILDILKKNGIQATFFVNGKSNRFLSDQLKRMAAEGHTIGMHGYSHRYSVIYASMENLLDDFYRNFLYIKSETGTAPELLRFPGGSINIFNVANYQSMVAEMLRRGFIYYDWNVSAGDAIAGASSQSVDGNIINGVHLCWGPAVVLMHDNGNMALRDALGLAIDTLKKEGYEFKRLDSSIKPPMFIYPD
jgi:peptidoglycan-N-acetylglucosamine deacetylase